MSTTKCGNELDVRELVATDLGEINAVVEAAVMGWDKAERVKRLALASCQYHADDFDHLTFFGAAGDDGKLVGAVCWETAEVVVGSGIVNALSLHGLYVHPRAQGHGAGSRLYELAAATALRCRLDGLFVKAMREAQGFFARQGMMLLPIQDPVRDYPHRYWLDLRDAA